MAHGYRTLQHWNQWLAHQFLGKHVLDVEKQAFSSLLNKHYGKHALLLGVPSQRDMLDATSVACHTLLSPFYHHDTVGNSIESDFHDLPLLTGSIDLVLLPHTLEFVDNPRQLLNEACRVVKPEGLIVITGFNPFSTWGMKKKFGTLIQRQHIKNWLKLADFALEDQGSYLYRPPVNSPAVFNKLNFLESIGGMLPAVAGVYAVVARAKVVPLTPIRLKWKQNLRDIRISSTIPGNIARHTK